MAHTKSAKKQIRSSRRKWMQNRYVKGQMRSTVKQMRQALSEGNAQVASTLAPELASQLDKAAKKHVIHKNKAARLKSRLMRQANALQK